MGVANIPVELNQVFMASGFQMPVTEFFVKMYASAYSRWLRGDGPLKTYEMVLEDTELLNCYAEHIEIHGARAMLQAHIENKDRLNQEPLPVGRVRWSNGLMHA